MKRLLVLLLLLGLGGAWAADAPVRETAISVSGTVLEVKDVENYTYLLIRTADGEIWAAILKTPVVAGAEVTIVDAAEMDGFESPTLQQRFDRIVFGRLADPGAVDAHHDMAAMHAAVGNSVEVAKVSVAKATGSDAHTVAEVIADRAALRDKPVTVRGQVAKFTPAILGKNWIHLRDGSGSASDGSNDILVTTVDQAKIGDIVLVKGVVRTDRDLGSGYSYQVLIEEATLVR
jgi:hypothetical protein